MLYYQEDKLTHSIKLTHPRVPGDLKGRFPSFCPLFSTYGPGCKMSPYGIEPRVTVQTNLCEGTG